MKLIDQSWIKRFIFISLLFLSSGAADAGQFTPATNNGALVWNKYPSRTRSIIWYGYADSSRRATGRGTALFLDEGKLVAAYYGIMVEGLMTGSTVAIYPKTGMGYFGEIENWNENGRGTMVYADGSFYTGDWCEGERSGMGGWFHENGETIFKGQFIDGAPAQPVTYRPPLNFNPSRRGRFLGATSSERRWIGPVDDSGFAHGFGTLVSSSSEGVSGIYFGRASSGTFDTDVVAIYALVGKAYVGSIRNWSEHGQGMMIYRDGSRYEGGWLNEKCSGIGTFFDAHGRLLHTGRFLNNKYLGPVQEPQPTYASSSSPSADSSNTSSSSATNSTYSEEDFPTSWDSLSARQKDAAYSIGLILLGQMVFDSMVSDEDGNVDILGAFFMVASRSYVRNPAVDNNLRVIFHNAPEIMIRVMRCVICAIADGKLNKLDENIWKAELIAAAQHIGANEQDALRFGLCLRDTIIKVNATR